MKHQLLILSLLAFLFVGCERTNQKTETTKSDETVDTVTNKKTDESEKVDESNQSDETVAFERIPHVAVETLKQLLAMEDNPLYLDGEAIGEVDFQEENGDEEHCYFDSFGDEEEMHVASDCFPLKDSGYAVIFSRAGGCCLCYSTSYYTCRFDDGALTEMENLLPSPTIGDFYANADQFPKEAYDILSGSSRIYQYDESLKQLTVTLDPYGCEESIRVFLPKAIRGLYLKIDESFEDFTEDQQREALGAGNYDIFPKIAYNWDGEKFLRDADNKPLEEDLKYFRKFNEFMKTAKCAQDLRKGDGHYDLDGDLNGDGFLDFVNNDLEMQELVVYLNDGTGVYNRFGVYECLKDFYIGNYFISDNGVLEVYVYGDAGDATYQFRFQDGDFYLTNHPGIKLGDFKFGESH
ncbi:MAG: hypothetical protein II887_07620 [Bacteroidales bacterium]|nr:hypothetical protein [Bacteroidales bacterium]